jgi:hypothetical protein
MYVSSRPAAMMFWFKIFPSSVRKALVDRCFIFNRNSIVVGLPGQRMRKKVNARSLYFVSLLGSCLTLTRDYQRA